MYLVKTDFIKTHKPIVLDCRYDLKDGNLGQALYNKSHLKGAFYVDLDKDLTAELAEHGGRHPLKDLEVFAEQMGSFGIKSDSKILIYDDGELAMASRLWFMLSLIGLESVYLLEGGFSAIEAAALELDQSVPERIQSQLTIAYQADLICDMEETKNAMSDDDVMIVDSRAKERYDGFVEPFDRIAGHIPTAVSYFWKDIFDAGQVRDYGKLEAHYLEMNNFKKVIVHCGSGVTGCVNMFFMKEVGIKSKLYLGSYSDWISYDDNDVVIKDQKIIKAKA